ncbi:MAG: DUF2339 domain-containing protein [Terriglobales bacterium]
MARDPTEFSGFTDLGGQLAALTRRVHALEQALREAGIALAARPAPPAPLTPPRMASQPEHALAAAAAAAAVGLAPEEAAPPPSLPADSLEERVGTHWFNYLGVLAVIVGLAWFLKLAMDRGWIGPAERVLIGVATGLILMYLGDRCAQRGLAVSGFGLNAAGTGALYLSLWAAHALYQLVPAAAVFVGMAAVTAYNGLRCWRDDSELFAALALVGGFLIPVLLANGRNHETELFLFLLILDTAIAALAALKPWAWLLPAALGGTVLLGLAWEVRYFNLFAWRETDAFIAAFAVLFLVAIRCLYSLRAPPEGDAVGVMPVVMPILVALIGFGAVADTLSDPILTHWRPWAALLFAALLLGLYRLPAGATDRIRRWRWTQLGLALGFATVAIPLRLHGRPLILAWLGEGVALMALARRLRPMVFIRGFVVAVLGLAVLLTLGANHYGGASPILNHRFATYLATIAATTVAAWLAAGEARVKDDDGGELPWSRLALGLGLAASLLPLIAGYFEIFTWWWGGSLGGYVAGPQLNAYRLGSQFSYSIWTMVYGAALLTIGFWRRLAPVRWIALILLLLAIAKVFLYDMSALSQGYRIVSFLGLGALLLAVSYAYQRDWLGLGRR